MNRWLVTAARTLLSTVAARVRPRITAQFTYFWRLCGLIGIFGTTCRLLPRTDLSRRSHWVSQSELPRLERRVESDADDS